MDFLYGRIKIETHLMLFLQDVSYRLMGQRIYHSVVEYSIILYYKVQYYII